MISIREMGGVVGVVDITCFLKTSPLPLLSEDQPQPFLWVRANLLWYIVGDMPAWAFRKLYVIYEGVFVCGKSLKQSYWTMI